MDSCPNKKAHGTLNFINKKLQLCILQNNFYGKVFFSDDIAEGVTICGNLLNGSKITLLGCLMIKHHVSLSADCSKDYEVYEPSSILLGDDIKSDGNVFTGAAAYYPLINAWQNNLCFLFNVKNNIDVDMKFSPNDIKFDLESKPNIKLAFISDYPSTIDFAISVMDDFAKLITCFVGVRCIYQDCIYLRNSNGNWITLLPNFIQEIDYKLSRAIPYNDITDSINNIVKSWWMKKEQLTIPIILFTDSCIAKRWELIPEFIKMVQALEVYSRRIKMPPLMPEEEFQEMITSILSDIKNEQYKSWLGKSLKSYRGYNEPTCAKRHMELYKKMSSLMGISVSNKKLSSISYRIVHTRNYYTHFSSEEGIYKKDSQIYYATIFMKYLLWTYILEEIGVVPAVISEYMRNADELHFALHQLTMCK